MASKRRWEDDLYSSHSRGVAEHTDVGHGPRQKARKHNIGSKRSHTREDRVCTTDRPTEDFKLLKPYPTVEDINSTEKVKLRENKQSGKFEDVNDYLDVQFRLLREDLVSAIRNGVRTVRTQPDLARRGLLKTGGDFKVYNNFWIEGLDVSNSGMCYNLRVDIRLNSKTLAYGSLICLSTSYFSRETDILFATVAGRGSANKSEPQGPPYQRKDKDGWRTIKIKFLPESLKAYTDMNSPAGPFNVVDPSTFFEAYTHVLKGLTTDYNLPMQKYIVRCETNIEKPLYIRDHELFYHLVPREYNHSQNMSSMSNFTTWPTAGDLALNQSQYEAFKAALTQEFSILQGPPGTGKTYVGLKIVQTLLGNLYNIGPCSNNELHNRHTPSSSDVVSKCSSFGALKVGLQPLQPDLMTVPILVVCYTNHALDQFLEGILEFCDKPGELVRVGSRSKSEQLKKCKLMCNYRGDRASLNLRNKLRNQKSTIMDKCKKLFDVSTKIQNGSFDFEVHKFVEEKEFSNQLKDWKSWLFKGNRRDVHKENKQFERWRSERMKSCESATAERVNEIPVFASASATDDMEKMEEFDDEKMKIEGLDPMEEDQSSVTLTLNIGAMQPTEQTLDESVMSQAEVTRLKARDNDLWRLPLAERWRLFKYWFHRYEKRSREDLLRYHQDLDECISQEAALRRTMDISALKRAKVIGMTTTAAARLQLVLQEVGPKIVVVEEAAEVLEAHIITALSSHCKHLILIGDHQQLKPNPAVYELAKRYHLDLSLFERMVNNRLPVSTLDIQHRMRPEISKYIKGHIYKNLQDHGSVFNRERIRGVSTSVFFFNHSNPEFSNVATMSKKNEFEANMIAKFARHLKRQGYCSEQLTVITMYKGQESLIKIKIGELGELDGLRVSSVDSFQGEESDIIFISLVRSNTENKLGFIDIENRVCVTMSRAKLGMYVFGDFDMIANQSEIWAEMIRKAKAAGEYGTGINLSCAHHQRAATVRTPEDFDTKAPQGGCIVPCNSMLECGHRCKQKCHYGVFQCQPCQEPCTKVLSGCSHDCTAPCYMWQEDREPKCQMQCEKRLDCGHLCKDPCGQRCGRCHEETDKVCPACKKMQRVLCSTEFRCLTPCKEQLDCGHECQGTCFSCYNKVYHKLCAQPCGEYLPCGHRCSDKCGNCAWRERCAPECYEKCLLKCSHGTLCSSEACIDVCTFKENLSRCLWGCERHSYCATECGHICTYKDCNRSCREELSCPLCRKGRKCRGLCGQCCPPLCKRCKLPDVEKRVKELPAPVCSIDKKTKWLELEDCSHILPVDYMDRWVKEHELPILCPFDDCKKPVLNTARYVGITRGYKWIFDERSKITNNKQKSSQGSSATSHNESQDDSNDRKTESGFQAGTTQRSSTRRSVSVDRDTRGRSNSRRDGDTDPHHHHRRSRDGGRAEPYSRAGGGRRSRTRSTSRYRYELHDQERRRERPGTSRSSQSAEVHSQQRTGHAPDTDTDINLMKE